MLCGGIRKYPIFRDSSEIKRIHKQCVPGVLFPSPLPPNAWVRGYVCSCGVATNIDDCAFITLLQDDWSPLLLACYEGQTEVVEILLKHGARLDIKNKVLQFIMCGELAIELR